MYKSKLQELCQRRSWDLPEYAMTREGPDHNPRFQATVLVDGVSFQSRDDCRSMKLAQNEVARLALRHFSSSSTGSSSANNVSANNITDQQRLLQVPREIVRDSEFSASVPIVEDDNRAKGISSQTPSLPLFSERQEVPDQAFCAKSAVGGNLQDEFPPGRPRMVTPDVPSKWIEVLEDGTSHEMNEPTNNISNQQSFQQEREVGRFPEFNVSTRIVKDGNRTEGFPSATAGLTNNTSMQRMFQEQRERDRVLASSGSVPIAYDGNKTKGIHHLYKNQLQTYAQKQNLNLPMYTSEREGPPHASRFRSKVTVGEQTFESQEFFPTLKEAEHAAAKIALASLAPDVGQEEDCLVYKNLLQEMAQKKGFLLPVYTTTRSGAVHVPTFLSTVEVAGKVFEGKEAKTKKLAEMSAAKVAYMSLKEGIPSQSPSLPMPSQRLEVPDQAFPAKSTLSSNLQEEFPPRRPRMVTPDAPSKWVEVHEEEPTSLDVLRESADVSLPLPPSSGSGNSAMNSNTKSATETLTATSALDQNTNASPTINGNNTELPVEKSTKKLIMGTGAGRFVSGGRVVVCPWTPGMTFPSDSELLFRDDDWVAFRVAPQTNQAQDV